MPVDVSAGAAGPVETTSDQALAWLSAGGHAGAIGVVWLCGAVFAVGLAVWRHARFAAAIKAGRAGPAAVGVIRPRLVIPADFAERFTPEERALVRAHERAHIDRLDARHNAVAALASWLCWFNPLLPLAARALRLDQELACDASVLEQRPETRRLYARTLLRTHQDAATPLLGCQWRGPGQHPLEARIRMLARPSPRPVRDDLAWTILLALLISSFGAAWAMQPPARVSWPARVTFVDLTPPGFNSGTLFLFPVTWTGGHPRYYTRKGDNRI